MDLIRDAVIKNLHDFSESNDRLLAVLDQLIAQEGVETYSTLIHVLTSLELEPEKAKTCWEKIIAHLATLNQSLKRDVNLRTAICDYFCSIDVSFKNPKIVEISVYEYKDKASKYDDLTSLYNRNYFNESLDREFARAKRYNQELSILFFDLDNFKQVNDSFGHMAGDVVLRNAAKIIRQEIRTEDIAARYGGEEFVIILPQTEKIRSLILGERIREGIKELSFDFQNREIHVTISGGLASFPIDTDNASDLVEFADQALYEAKSNGKNNISVFSKNKRKYLRFELSSEILIKNLKSNGNASHIVANSKNFSKAGMLFKSVVPLEIGTLIQVSVPTGQESEDITITGNIIRVEIFAADEYEIGVSFIKVDKSLENDISKFMINYFSNSPA